jgi:uncharacterized membrane protein YidH (DUF202 family)
MPAKKKRATRARKKSRKPGSKKNNDRKKRIALEEERTLFMKEQTILSKERTILSFMRTGLGFITAGFAIIAATAILESFLKVHPMLSFTIGSAIVIVGFLEIIESFRRLNAYRKKMKEIAEELGDECI